MVEDRRMTGWVMVELKRGRRSTCRVIAKLKYEIPSARDLPLQDIYAAYDRFLDELKDRGDARHRAARQRLIDRVKRLADKN